MFFSRSWPRHSIDKTKKYLGKNSFRLNCDRLAMVQFLQDRQSVSLFLESNYSQIIAKARETEPGNSSLKSEWKIEIEYTSNSHISSWQSQSLRSRFVNVSCGGQLTTHQLTMTAPIFSFPMMMMIAITNHHIDLNSYDVYDDGNHEFGRKADHDHDGQAPDNHDNAHDSDQHWWV